MNKENQQKIASEFGLDLTNLQPTPVTHEDNPVTKKDIFEHASKRQRELLIFHHKDGVTWQDLDPRLNRYGSVRFQFIKNCGHGITEKIKVWKCGIEDCEHLQTEAVHYFITFGDAKKTISRDRIHPDDIHYVGVPGSPASHVLSGHPEEGAKRLGKMGVKIS